MNPFNQSDIVRTVNGNRTGGVVKYIACKAATLAGGRTCDKKTCNHYVKDFVWVKWTDNSICSYEHSELAFEKAIAPDPIKIIEKESTDKIDTIPSLPKPEDRIDFNLYNGITAIRYTRDGKEVIVDVSGQGLAIPPIEEKDLDFEAYNTKDVVRKKRV